MNRFIRTAAMLLVLGIPSVAHAQELTVVAASHHTQEYDYNVNSPANSKVWAAWDAEQAAAKAGKMTQAQLDDRIRTAADGSAVEEMISESETEQRYVLANGRCLTISKLTVT